MPAIRSITKIADKWSTVTSARGPQYEEGVRDPKKSWSEEAKKANDTYVKAVTMAAQQGRYAAGVEKAGDRKWQERAIKVGPGRFAEGVLISKDEYAKGFGPFAEEIAAIELPKKAPKGSRENLERVWAIASRLHEKKLALLGTK
ncbi:MAG: hypothetical protein DRP01_04275 [Archaeoglobales archaeon]|nr:MAG: hypothetical protein DRP01_04275 [Archaeoglobales archaeon]HDD36636.1 hypothetical protein [Archaeoglobus veneficus]